MSRGEREGEQTKVLVQQLAEKEAIINGISDTLMLLDAKTYEILEVNQPFLDAYGLSREEVLGHTCYQVTHHLDRPCHHEEDDCPCPLEHSITTGNPCHVEHLHKDREGNPHYFEISTYPLKDESGQVGRIIHLSRDITDRKNLERQLREKEKLSGILELAGGTSHEINQPLTVIIGGLEQLVKRLTPGALEYELAEAALNHARRLKEVSKKLAQITRYVSKDYVAGQRIFDLDKSSEQEG